ncbi:envelope stress response membrane protein PspC [Citromicrobium bathyomarinum]|uniref:envelope stress response membrane protein PspC n=1 Tax=Citromicrobium sp. JLT1363 TaxID=517722 RepID=UPI000225DF15|nr:envelope stress response membrane protein PspC [Citromicrobium sp. JLT1363]
MNTSRTTLYKDEQNAKLMGVCAGLADYTGVDVLWWRLGMLFMIWPSGGLILVAYLIMGLMLNKKPSHLYTADKQEQKYWQGVRANPKRTAREIRGKLREIDRRLANVEEHYVSSNPRLDAEIERLR